jgi:hypothetical protein
LLISHKDRGGLIIRDHFLLNLELGGKLFWRMIMGRVDWWKKVLWKNYFNVVRKRCIEGK